MKSTPRPHWSLRYENGREGWGYYLHAPSGDATGLCCGYCKAVAKATLRSVQQALETRKK